METAKPSTSVDHATPESELDPAKLFDALLNDVPSSSDDQVAPPSAELNAKTPSNTVALINPQAQELLQQFKYLLGATGSLQGGEQITLLQELKSTVELLLDGLQREVAPLPEGDFPRFQNAPADTDPYNWLGQHWGAWLQHFTPSLSRDYLYLDQLGALDPELKNALYAKRRNILRRTGLKVSQIVPKKSARLDLQIQQADPEQLKQAVRTYVLPRVRKSKASST